MKKTLVLLLAVLMVAALMVGCTAPAKTRTKVNLAVFNGPTGIGAVKLWDDQNKGTAKNDYQIAFSGAPDEIVAKISNGELDIAAVPINLAGALYNKTNGGVEILAINTLGVLSVVERGNTVNAMADLKGKTLTATGQGGTPEYVLNYLIAKNDVKNVTVEYKTEHAELATLLLNKSINLAMLPEPFVTTVLNKDNTLRVALNLTEQWSTNTTAQGNKTDLSMGCIVVRKAFLTENPKAVEDFLSEYAASVAYVNSNVDAAAALVKQAGIMGDEALAKLAIPRCNIVCITGAQMKTSVQALYTVLFEANPKSIGGKIPADDFYYVKAD